MCVCVCTRELHHSSGSDTDLNFPACDVNMATKTSVGETLGCGALVVLALMNMVLGIDPDPGGRVEAVESSALPFLMSAVSFCLHPGNKTMEGVVTSVNTGKLTAVPPLASRLKQSDLL